MILLISDLHLDPKRPATVQAFFGFLSTHAQKAQALYILGDFFEAWLGDDDDTPIYLEVTQALRDYVDQGHKVYFMHGNRDFLVGERFAKASGATLLPDPFILEHAGERYLLMHGDSLCTLDHDYMQFRAMVRTPDWQAAILSKSLDERRAYAAQARQQSQSMTSLKAEDILDVTPAEVVKAMKAHDVEHFIHGHTHRPKIHELKLDDNNDTLAKRYVLGDWDSHGWYIQIEQKNISLEKFPIVS